jgi:hypothetical protein
LTANAARPDQVDLEWTPATDNIAVIGYQIQRATSNTFPTSHDTVTLPLYTNVVIESGKVIYSDETVSSNTQYYYRIKAFDAQPNYSVSWSNTATATTPAIPDTTPPTVVMLAPPSTVSGTQILSATANDTESGVKRVDFYITPQSGSPSRFLGSKLTPNTGTNQYDFSWNTTLDGGGNAIADGVYTLSAIAYDNADNMSVPSFRPNITVANAVNAVPTLQPLTLTPGDLSITADLDFADSDGTVDEVYIEVSADGANQNSAKGTQGWETVVDGVAPDTSATHQVIVTEFDGTPLAQGETLHFRAWVVDNDGGISARRFANAATNPPVTGGGDFMQTDDLGSGSDFVMTDFGDFVQTDPI